MAASESGSTVPSASTAAGGITCATSAASAASAASTGSAALLARACRPRSRAWTRVAASESGSTVPSASTAAGGAGSSFTLLLSSCRSSTPSTSFVRGRSCTPSFCRSSTPSPSSCGSTILARRRSSDPPRAGESGLDSRGAWAPLSAERGAGGCGSRAAADADANGASTVSKNDVFRGAAAESAVEALAAGEGNGRGDGTATGVGATEVAAGPSNGTSTRRAPSARAPAVRRTSDSTLASCASASRLSASASSIDCATRLDAADGGRSVLSPTFVAV